MLHVLLHKMLHVLLHLFFYKKDLQIEMIMCIIMMRRVDFRIPIHPFRFIYSGMQKEGMQNEI